MQTIKLQRRHDNRTQTNIRNKTTVSMCTYNKEFVLYLCNRFQCKSRLTDMIIIVHEDKRSRVSSVSKKVKRRSNVADVYSDRKAITGKQMHMCHVQHMTRNQDYIRN